MKPVSDDISEFQLRDPSSLDSAVQIEPLNLCLGQALTRNDHFLQCFVNVNIPIFIYVRKLTTELHKLHTFDEIRIILISQHCEKLLIKILRFIIGHRHVKVWFIAFQHGI